MGTSCEFSWVLQDVQQLRVVQLQQHACDGASAFRSVQLMDVRVELVSNGLLCFPGAGLSDAGLKNKLVSYKASQVC